MGHWRWIVVLWALAILAAPREGEAQTEEDEKRPYKFAFSIEGYQHRSEEKDEKGIIMGEFGFVTGDGVYHVTVYATDENGDFKILKMKNYYVGLPGEGTTDPPSRAPLQTTAPPPPPKPTTTPSPIIKHLQGLMGCSGCIVPDKSMGGPLSESSEGLIDERFGGRPGIPGTTGGSPGYSGSPGAAGGGVGKPGSSSKPGYQTGKPAYNEKTQGGTQGIGGSPAGFGGGSGGGKPLNPGSPSPPGSQIGQGQAGQFPQPPGSPSPSRAGPTQTGASPLGRPIGGSGSPTPRVPGSPTGGPVGQHAKSTAPPGSTGPGQPSRSPGQVYEGLPPGVSLGDMMDLLYKFNYTLKYHGHNEKGYKGGEKEGGYFFNGRDGLGRNVEYIANEFGFQPNITLVDLGLAAPDTPKEPEEPNELRGNEFKWYYAKR